MINLATRPLIFTNQAQITTHHPKVEKLLNTVASNVLPRLCIVISVYRMLHVDALIEAKNSISFEKSINPIWHRVSPRPCNS